MALLNWFKKIFSNNIIPERLDNSKIINTYTLKRGLFKIGSKIEVPAGYKFIITHKGKLYDILDEGTYQIYENTVPKIWKKLNLSGRDKDGKPIQKFKAEALYINIGSLPSIFISNYRKLSFQDDEKKTYSIGFEYEIKYSFSKFDKFIKVLLREFNIIKNDDAVKLISSLLTEIITEKINKKDFTKEQYQSNDQQIFSFVEELVRRVLLEIGLSLDSIETKKFSVREKGILKSVIASNKLSSAILDKISVNLPSDLKQNPEVKMYDDEIATIKIIDKKFVDLNLNNLYDHIVNKPCPKCGAMNRDGAIICFKCGADLKGEQIIEKQ